MKIPSKNNNLTISTKKTQCKRYYYSKDKVFEKSLDIYTPTPDVNDDVDNNNNRNSKNDKPVIILVVGSGWVGHRSIIYSMCSWWNSSGPKTFAKLGYTCICVRHRGAFPVLPQPITKQILVCMVVFSILYDWNSLRCMTLVCILFCMLIALGRHGSASFSVMLNDVTEALVWIQHHRKHQQDSITNLLVSSSPIIFGGYSSGGHVAATLLQTPELFISHGLPPPEKLFTSILMISAVLAVRPLEIIDDTFTNKQKQLVTSWSPPRWFTDFILFLVWGKKEADNIPSPIQHLFNNVDNPQESTFNLPHLFIGCKHEVFGLNVLDLMFCSKQYVQILQSKGCNTNAKRVEVKSNHWSILNSTNFAIAIQENITSKINTKKLS